MRIQKYYLGENFVRVLLANQISF